MKIRGPGVVGQIETDLEILRNSARRAKRNWHHSERFATNFALDSRVHVPTVFGEATSSQTITLERVQGITFSDLEALEEAGIDRSELAQRAARVLLKTASFTPTRTQVISSSGPTAHSTSSTSGWSARLTS